MRIVLDTNVLVSGIFWGGTPLKILECWIQDKFQLLITAEILKEYQNTLKKISKQKADNLVDTWIMLIAENAIAVNVRKNFKLSIDPDDNKFIDCAVSGNADCITSGDAHLLDLKSIMNIVILKPKDLLNIILKKI